MYPDFVLVLSYHILSRPAKLCNVPPTRAIIGPAERSCHSALGRLNAYLRRYGSFPLMRDLAWLMRLSPSVVKHELQSTYRAGYRTLLPHCILLHSLYLPTKSYEQCSLCTALYRCSFCCSQGYRAAIETHKHLRSRLFLSQRQPISGTTRFLAWVTLRSAHVTMKKSESSQSAFKIVCQLQER